MTITIPESVSAEGNVKVTFVPAIADTSAPTATVLNGASSVAMDVFMLSGWGGLTSNQNTGQDRRFASKEGFDRLGRITRSLAALQYTWNPQEDASDPANDAYVALDEGTTGFFVFGFGKDPADAWAATDLTWIVPVECGAQNPDVTGADEFAPLTITQTVGITGTTVRDVAVV